MNQTARRAGMVEDSRGAKSGRERKESSSSHGQLERNCQKY